MPTTKPKNKRKRARNQAKRKRHLNQDRTKWRK